jgi:hypothetical protein
MSTQTETPVEGSNGRRFVVYREEEGLRKWTIAEWLDTGSNQQALVDVGVGYGSRREAVERARQMGDEGVILDLSSNTLEDIVDGLISPEPGSSESAAMIRAVASATVPRLRALAVLTRPYNGVFQADPPGMPGATHFDGYARIDELVSLIESDLIEVEEED